MLWFLPAVRQTVCRPIRPAMTRPDELADAHRSCGWFDSSWELAQGLKVQEHTAFERLPPEVPLEWLLQ